MARLVLAFLALSTLALTPHVAHTASWDAAGLVLASWVGGVLFGLLGVLAALEEPRPARALTDALPDGSPLKPARKWRAF